MAFKILTGSQTFEERLVKEFVQQQFVRNLKTSVKVRIFGLEIDSVLVFLGLLFLICGGIMTFQTEAYDDFQQKSRTKDVTTPTPLGFFAQEALDLF